MRTTVTIDPDVEELLRQAMARQRTTFKQTLNEALRRGLRGESPEGDGEFHVRARAMNLRAGVDPARLADLEDELEVSEFVRKTAALVRLAPAEPSKSTD